MVKVRGQSSNRNTVEQKIAKKSRVTKTRPVLRHGARRQDFKDLE